MSLELFFNQFDLITTAPNGVARLREMILDLAVRGQLVEQRDGEEPARKLLEKIRAEKKRISGEKGKAKLFDDVSSIDEIDEPFAIPENWVWTRLGDVIKYDAGQKVKPNDIPEDAWLLELEDIEKDTSKIIQRLKFKERNSKSDKAKFYNGDVLYGKLRPYLNKVVVADSDGFCTTEIVALRSYHGIFPEFLKISLKRSDFLAFVNEKSYGVKMPRLGTSDANNSLFPLPPLEEQKRIVEKVKELMRLCNRLEAQIGRREELRKTLNRSALEHLQSARTAEDFQNHFGTIVENFTSITDAPAQIPGLRQTVLQLAVQGKLVAQDATDEPAAVLLEKIKAEKRRLANGKAKLFDDAETIAENETPFEIPKGWVWARVENISKKIEYGTSAKAESFKQGVPVLRMNNIVNGKVVLENLKYLPEETEDLPRLFLKNNELLFNRTNSFELVGKTGIFKGEDDTHTFASYLIRIVLFTDKTYPDFINLAMNANYYRETQINPEITQQCGQANFNGTKLSKTLIPFPPLAEQKRIVAKVEELFALCDALENHLTEKQTKSSILLSSLVSHV